MEKVKIVQIKSKIGRPKDQKRTLEALGLKKINGIVEVKSSKTFNNPLIDGKKNKWVL